MAVAVTIDIPGGNQQAYEQLTAKLFQDGKLPEGWQVHLAGLTLGSAPRRAERARKASTAGHEVRLEY